jgi:hypothetical protein
VGLTTDFFLSGTHSFVLVITMNLTFCEWCQEWEHEVQQCQDCGRYACIPCEQVRWRWDNRCRKCYILLLKKLHALSEKPIPSKL